MLCLIIENISWNSGVWLRLCGGCRSLIICLNGMFWFFCVVSIVLWILFSRFWKCLLGCMWVCIISVLLKKLIRLVILVCMWFVIGVLIIRLVFLVCCYINRLNMVRLVMNGVML